MTKLTPYSDTNQRLSFLRGQFFGTIPMPTSISIHTIIITGANTGLGFSAAQQLLATSPPSRLILACRSTSKGEAARELLLTTISTSTKCPPKGSNKNNDGNKCEILVWQLDMCSKSSILAFSQRCTTLDRLDAIVLNAGVDTMIYETAESYEMTIMVNVIGTMLLATLMVPIVRDRSDGGRISIVGSAVQFMTDYQILVDGLDASDGKGSSRGILKWLSEENQWKRNGGEDRYMLSKGILQMMVQQLAKIVPESGKEMVVVNCVAPGYCRTELFRENTGVQNRLKLKLVARDAEVGARALIVGAVGVEGGVKSHGGYMSEGIIKKASSWFETEQGQEISRRIWTEVVSEIEGVKMDAVRML